MRTLALIPARSGSKGIPGKNTRPFAGAPLYARAVVIGQVTCTWTYVSTDDAALAYEAASAYGVDLIARPSELAQDDTPMLAVIQHALSAVEPKPDVLVLLQPTQPLRKALHVQRALHLLSTSDADSVVSVVPIPAHYSPDYALARRLDGRLMPFLGTYDRDIDDMPTRRQDAHPAYSRDGTVYAIRRQTIEAGSLYGNHCIPLVIDPSESVNLDTEEDWRRAEAMVRS
jgi:CMP-N,N'-diacetyllegionaminic acid synthase